MPETLEATIAEDENFTPTYDEADLRIPMPEPEKAEAEPEVEETETPTVPPGTVEPAAKPSVHSLDMIAQAARLDISTEEIEEMTPAELKREVARATRMRTELETLKAQLAPKPTQEVKADPIDELLKTLDDETLFDPKHAAVIKALAAQNKQLQSQVASIAPSVRDVQMQTAYQQIDAALDAVAPGLSKQIAQGQPKAAEFWEVMNAFSQHEAATGRFTSHAERARKAMRAIDLAPKVNPKAAEDAEKEKALEAEKERFDKGGLAKAVNRKPAHDTIQQVEEILDGMKKQKNAADYKPKWND